MQRKRWKGSHFENDGKGSARPANIVPHPMRSFLLSPLRFTLHLPCRRLRRPAVVSTDKPKWQGRNHRRLRRPAGDTQIGRNFAARADPHGVRHPCCLTLRSLRR
jgi:hypothetical protein